VEAEDVEGVIEAIDGMVITISGTEAIITDRTRVRGERGRPLIAADLQIGMSVKVEFIPSADGTLSGRIRGPVTTSAEVTFPLEAAYPNPFNPDTTIGFSLSEPAGNLRLDVFDLLGRRVITLSVGSLGAGHHQVSWDGRTGEGRESATGIYMYRLTVGTQSIARPMVLLR
jgi:flagellar hook assembly protein FlgD